MLGEFLEISAHSGNVLEALQWHERLGFTQLRSNDTWSHPYGIITDGRLMLGIHAYEFPSPALTFVAPELRKRVEPLAALGIEFEFLKIADDQFHELGFLTRDEQMMTLIEARTFSPPPGDIAASALGFFHELLLPVSDQQAAAEEWRQFGWLEDEQESTFGATRFCSSGLNVALSESRKVRQPVLVFHCPSLPALAALCEQRGIEPAKTEADAIWLASPDGLRYYVLQDPDT